MDILKIAGDEQNNLPGTNWCPYNGTGHPHLDVEENFNPNLTGDPLNGYHKVYTMI